MKSDEEQGRFVRELIRFETELYRQDKMPALIIAATLVMANKQIDQSTFQELWEEIKMLNVLKFAHEKGWEEGKVEGRVEAARELVMATLEDSVGIVPAYIADEVMSLSRQDILRALLRQAVKCKEIGEFEKMLKLASGKAEGQSPPS